jgi:hypothetical protein
LAERRQPGFFVVEACVLPVYVVFAVPPSLAGVAVVLAVIRAKKDDLPDIVRALMRVGPRDDDSRKPPPPLPVPDYDDEPTPPSLPKP